jgi:hypothetical protein
MELDRRSFIGGAVGLAADGAMTAFSQSPTPKSAAMPPAANREVMLPKDLDLPRLQRTTLHYLIHETNPDNGLVRDKTDPSAPCSIAVVGMALASLPAMTECGVLFRPFAAKIARHKLKFLSDLPQGPEPNASGYKGLFYHFLDI